MHVIEPGGFCEVRLNEVGHMMEAGVSQRKGAFGPDGSEPRVPFKRRAMEPCVPFKRRAIEPRVPLKRRAPEPRVPGKDEAIKIRLTLEGSRLIRAGKLGTRAAQPGRLLCRPVAGFFQRLALLQQGIGPGVPRLAALSKKLPGLVPVHARRPPAASNLKCHAANNSRDPSCNTIERMRSSSRALMPGPRRRAVW